VLRDVTLRRLFGVAAMLETRFFAGIVAIRQGS
jgi:hypothetical protein